jgi:hypothetical protein
LETLRVAARVENEITRSMGNPPAFNRNVEAADLNCDAALPAWEPGVRGWLGRLAALMRGSRRGGTHSSGDPLASRGIDPIARDRWERN